MARLSDLIRTQQEGTRLPTGTPSAFAPLSMAGRLGSPATASPATLNNPETQALYEDAQAEIARLGQAIQAHRPLEVDRVGRLAEALAAALCESDVLLERALHNGSTAQLTSNPVNVAILGVCIGRELCYSDDQLEQLAFAGLLHDAGMFLIPAELVEKVGPLTAEERATIERHPQLGYELLKGLDQRYAWLATIVAQEHERVQGTGYPSRLRGAQIEEFAQIIGLVDTFDAMICPRPYRRARSPHDALRDLMTREKTSFPKHHLKALVDHLGLYPIGTDVRLSNGAVGKVSAVPRGVPLRPLVRIAPGSDGGAAGSSKVVDLSKNSQVHIVEVVRTKEGRDNL
jgi:HD-GYP domain-containing protein (c-di-GMP phosphodiesterase class II)